MTKKNEDYDRLAKWSAPMSSADDMRAMAKMIKEGKIKVEGEPEHPLGGLERGGKPWQRRA